MPRQLAITVFVFFILWLFVRDRKLRPMTSPALLAPLLWLVIIGSRPISFWLNGKPIIYQNPQDAVEGSPLDASFFLILIVVGMVVLMVRNVPWSRILSLNKWLVVFYLYCLISVIWADYPFVVFKRWIKDVGNIIMVLIILSEQDPVAAIKAVFARYTYFALTISVLFIKYMPEFGRYYNRWTWEVTYCGVTDEKNALGALVFISGTFLIWDLFDEMRTKRREEQSKAVNTIPPIRSRTRASFLKQEDETHLKTSATAGYFGGMAIPDLAARIALLVMMIWLVNKADSSNALVCLLIGVGIILVLQSSVGKRQIRYLGRYTLIFFLVVFFVYSIPGVLEGLLEMLGENISLSGRTIIWADLLNGANNYFFGTGYQSFWLGGPVVDKLWQKFYFHPNQAHNGYLETYLNVGLIGLFLLTAMILSAGASLKNKILIQSKGSVLLFSFFVCALFYNWSEAMFNKLSPVWFILLTATLNYSNVPGTSEVLAESATPKSRPRNNLRYNRRRSFPVSHGAIIVGKFKKII